MLTDEQIERAVAGLAGAHFCGRVAALTQVLAEIERFRNDPSGLNPLDLLQNRVAVMIGEAIRAAQR